MPSEMTGQRVVDVRPMAADEYTEQFWHEPTISETTAIDLENGTTLYPSHDPEGNGPGVFHPDADFDLTSLVGATLTSIDPMSQAATDARGWTLARNHGSPAPVLSFETPNGLEKQVYVAQDSEENGPGMLFYTTPDGKDKSIFFEVQEQ